jgi:hypothetical protein
LKELDKPFILVAPSVLLCYKYFQEDFKDHLQIIVPFNRVKFRMFKCDEKNGLLIWLDQVLPNYKKDEWNLL